MLVAKSEKIEMIEVPNEGFYSLMQKQVLIICFNYFYTGKLIGVGTDFIKLEDCYLVYETGAWSENNFKDAQKIGKEHFVLISSIESFCQTFKKTI